MTSSQKEERKPFCFYLSPKMNILHRHQSAELACLNCELLSLLFRFWVCAADLLSPWSTSKGVIHMQAV